MGNHWTPVSSQMQGHSLELSLPQGGLELVSLNLWNTHHRSHLSALHTLGSSMSWASLQPLPKPTKTQVSAPPEENSCLWLCLPPNYSWNDIVRFVLLFEADICNRFFNIGLSSYVKVTAPLNVNQRVRVSINVQLCTAQWNYQSCEAPSICFDLCVKWIWFLVNFFPLCFTAV